MGTFSGVGNTTWTERSLSLTLTSGIKTLTFSGTGSYDTLLDNVHLAAVPEPSTCFAGLTALGALGMLMRRNRG